MELSWSSASQVNSFPNPIAGTEDDVLYTIERSAPGGGSFSYAIPVENGSYRVRLRWSRCAGCQSAYSTC
jgi:hypothetical protein